MLLGAFLVAILCTTINAAYWNQNRAKTNSQGRDLDGDGIPNIVDPDIDNDGLVNAFDENVDGGIAKSGPYAGQYLGDHETNDSPSEKDIDDDGLADDSLGENDIDGDQTSDSSDSDIDGDGRKNDAPSEIDIDSDGIRNDDAMESDEDGDGADDLEDDDDNNNGVRDIDDLDHHPEEGESEHQVDLTAQAAAPDESSVKITLQWFGSGSIKFSVDGRDLAAGSYDLLVGGAVRGILVMGQESSKTSGELVFKSADSGSGSQLLDFTVAGQAIEIRQGATAYFTGTAPALSTEEGDREITLTRSSGTGAEARAVVLIHFGSAGPDELEIHLEKLPPGEYSVVIGEAARGSVNVTGPPGETEGVIHFNKEASGDESPLDFPAAGQPISLVQGTTTIFFGQLPEAAAP